MPRPRPKLRWLLSTWFVFILLATLLVLSIGIYYMIGQYNYRSGVARLRSQAISGLNRAATNDEGEVNNEDALPRHPFVVGDDFEAKAQRMADQIGSRFLLARVMTLDGRPLGASQTSSHAPGINTAQIEAFKLLLERREPDRGIVRMYLSYFEGSAGHPWQVVLFPLTHGGQLVGILQVAQSWREQEALQATLRGYLLGGSAVATVVGLLACFWLSRSLLRPLERLEETTRRVAAGDLNARAFPTHGTREVVAVADAFDDMVDRLQSSFEAQRRFVGDASHELKTPLTAIGGMAEMLRTGVTEGSPEKRQRALDTIEREVDKMARLVNDLLTLSRTEVGSEAPRETTRVDLHALLHEAAGYALTAGQAHAFTLQSTEGLTVEGDHDQLSRVLRNFLDNAFKYTPPGGAVTLRSRRTSTQAVIDVIDTGVGIAPEDLPHVFDRFYRADPSRTRRTGGSGLGLAIVRAIVSQHGGTVNVESTPGQGARFTVALPLAPSTGPDKL